MPGFDILLFDAHPEVQERGRETIWHGGIHEKI